MIDFVGYAPNPKNLKRNQILSMSYHQGPSTPKFRSQLDREKVFGKQESKKKELGVGFLRDSDCSHFQNQQDIHSLIPKYYMKVDIKYSKFGVEDFDFSFYNKSLFGGLENVISLMKLHTLAYTKWVLQFYATGSLFC